MSDSGARPRWRGPVLLSEIVGRVLDPVTARRGFAAADLIAAWPEIVGRRYADCTAPERIVWPRHNDGGSAGVLHLRVDGPRAVLVQHELGQIIERINAFLGYAAVARVRLVQAPVGSPPKPAVSVRPLGAEDEARLDAAVDGVEDGPLKAALAELGRGILARRR